MQRSERSRRRGREGTARGTRANTQPRRHSPGEAEEALQQQQQQQQTAVYALSAARHHSSAAARLQAERQCSVQSPPGLCPCLSACAVCALTLHCVVRCVGGGGAPRTKEQSKPPPTCALHTTHSPRSVTRTHASKGHKQHVRLLAGLPLPAWERRLSGVSARRADPKQRSALRPCALFPFSSSTPTPPTYPTHGQTHSRKREARCSCASLCPPSPLLSSPLLSLSALLCSALLCAALLAKRSSIAANIAARARHIAASAHTGRTEKQCSSQLLQRCFAPLLFLCLPSLCSAAPARCCCCCCCCTFFFFFFFSALSSALLLAIDMSFLSAVSYPFSAIEFGSGQSPHSHAHSD